MNERDAMNPETDDVIGTPIPLELLDRAADQLSNLAAAWDPPQARHRRGPGRTPSAARDLSRRACAVLATPGRRLPLRHMPRLHPPHLGARRLLAEPQRRPDCGAASGAHCGRLVPRPTCCTPHPDPRRFGGPTVTLPAMNTTAGKAGEAP